MASNAVPKNKDEVIATLKDVIAGLTTHEVPIGIKQNTGVFLTSVLEAFIGKAAVPADPGPPPVAAIPAVLGADKDYEMKQAVEKAAAKAVSDQDKLDRTYLGQVRKWIAMQYGESWNAQWIPTGFPGSSTAVPGGQDLRHTLLFSLSGFFAAHPELEVTTPTKVITAASLAARHTAMTVLRTALNTASNQRDAAKDTAEAAEQAMRDGLSGFVGELSQRIPSDDSRWELFGLNIPADPDLPEAVAGLTLTALGGAKMKGEWPRAKRARRYRRFLQIVGVDEDFVFIEPNVIGSGPTLQTLLENLPVGATVRLKIIAANDAGEAGESNVAEGVVT